MNSTASTLTDYNVADLARMAGLETPYNQTDRFLTDIQDNTNELDIETMHEDDAQAIGDSAATFATRDAMWHAFASLGAWRLANETIQLNNGQLNDFNETAETTLYLAAHEIAVNLIRERRELADDIELNQDEDEEEGQA